MKAKKGQMGTGMVLAISIPLIIGVIVLALVFGLLRDQTSISSIANDTFTTSNTTCTRVTPNCLYSLTSVANATGGENIGIGNFSTCKVGDDLAGVLFEGTAGVDISDKYNGQLMNVSYDELACNYIAGGMTRTLVLYLPILLGVLLFVFVAGYIGMKGRG